MTISMFETPNNCPQIPRNSFNKPKLSLINMKKIVVFLSLFFLSSLAMAQVQIKGMVKGDNGKPLEEASIIDVKSKKGTFTNSSGMFMVSVASLPASLEVSFTGYQRKTITVNTTSITEINLVSKNTELGEVIVVGFGTQKKASQTGAIVSVSQADLKNTPTANVVNALAGRLPGLITQQRSGLPGGDASLLLIRGYGTFNTAGQTPLILVDGVERRFNEVDFNEVDNISILKDASATAVFGVRGANGVIIITTKRGILSAPKVTVSIDRTMQRPTRLPKYLQSYDYSTLFNEAYLNDGGDPNFMPYNATALQKYKDGSDPYLFPDVNWYDTLLRPSAPQLQANVTVRGGTSQLKYFLTGTFLDQEGLLRPELTKFAGYNTNTKYQRFNFRSNIDYTLTKNTVFSMSLSAKHAKQVVPSDGLDFGSGATSLLWWNMARWAPNHAPVYNPDGSLGAFYGNSNLIGDIARKGFTNNFRTDIEANMDLKQKLDMITPGLSFRTKFVYDTYFEYAERRSKTYQAFDYSLNNGGRPVYTARGAESALAFTWVSTFSTKHTYVESAFDYKRAFAGKHEFTGLALFFADRTRSGSGFPFSKLGYAGRSTYAYKGKYLAEANIGYNGTENFAKGMRMGFFPAFSAGWLITEEAWMEKKAPWISYLKLRLSSGKVGNANIGGRRYLYLPDTWGAATGYNFGSGAANALGGSFELNLGNPNVTWETAWKHNIGLESMFFNKSLSVNFDVFYDKRDNILLIRQDVPTLIGQANTPPVNVGKMENKGYELEVKYNKRLSKDFAFDIGGNYNYARNKILYQTEPQRPYPWMERTGKRFGEKFGYIAEGFFNSKEEISKWADQSIFGVIVPGDIKYKDLNGDGKIDQYDQGNIGNPDLPEITYAITNGISYKNFELDVMFQGVTNTSLLVSSQGGWEFYNSAKVANHHMGRWTPATAATATYPRLTQSSSTAKNNFQNSTFWVRDASYIRLKNVALSYNFSKTIVQRLGVDALRLSLTAANIYTWSSFKWFDPEIRTSAGNVYPQLQTYNFTIYTTF